MFKKLQQNWEQKITKRASFKNILFFNASSIHLDLLVSHLPYESQYSNDLQ